MSFNLNSFIMDGQQKGTQSWRECTTVCSAELYVNLVGQYTDADPVHLVQRILCRHVEQQENCR